MDDINGRVKKIRATLGLSQRQFSKRIFISQSFFGDLELGKQEVNDRIAHLISSQFNVNIEWLKFGIGEMFSSQPPNIKLERLIGRRGPYPGACSGKIATTRTVLNDLCIWVWTKNPLTSSRGRV